MVQLKYSLPDRSSHLLSLPHNDEHVRRPRESVQNRRIFSASQEESESAQTRRRPSCLFQPQVHHWHFLPTNGRE